MDKKSFNSKAEYTNYKWRKIIKAILMECDRFDNNEAVSNVKRICEEALDD